MFGGEEQKQVFLKKQSHFATKFGTCLKIRGSAEQETARDADLAPGAKGPFASAAA